MTLKQPKMTWKQNIVWFPKVRREYECRFCKHNKVEEGREFWLFGKPIQNYINFIIGWIMIVILYPFIHNKIYFKEE